MSEWSTKKLGSMCNKIGAGSTPTGGKESYKKEGISLIRSQNVGDFVFLYDGLAFIDVKQARKLNNVTVQENDTLINITGDSVARVCSAPAKIIPARVNQHVAIVRADGVQLDNAFVKYALLSMKEHILSISEIGATRRALTKEMLENLDIFLPSFPTQKVIAEILSSLDDKIDLLVRQNQTLEGLALTYVRHWFGEGPDKVRLGDYFPVKTGKQDANIAVDDGEYIFFTCSKEPLRTDNYSFNEPSILLAGNGDFNVKWYRGKFEAYQRTYVLTPYNPDDLPWLYFAISHYLNDITNGHRGSVINFITKGMIEDFTITLPAISDFSKFKYLANDTINKQESNLKQISIIQKLRDTLLPKLICGEVRVKI